MRLNPAQTQLDIKEAQQELVTLRDIIRWGVSRFAEFPLYYGHGMANALDETVFLALSALNLPQNIDMSYFESRLTSTEKTTILELYKQRCEQQLPAAYLVNEAWFAGLKFYVDQNVLVPRSPIAELIENRFEPWVDPENVDSILDLCTGSGCIAIACAYAFHWAEVDAVDLSLPAVEIARKNVINHQLQDQVTVYQSDLFDAVASNTYDIIVTNPPYVDAEDMAILPEEFHKEPEIGLASGDDGLDITRKILQQAAQHLNPGGILVVEVGNSEHALQELLPEVSFYWLEFERGGTGVFLLTYEQLTEYQHLFDRL